LGYDAFISYSHAADGLLAPSLQRGMQRLAKPWNRRRALHVFRDETGLSTNPHLWSSIEAALDSSEWFVLLASPEAARSEWVNREIAHWMATKPADRVLPVVTDGEWSWDAGAGVLDGDAVPDALRAALREEPRHLDLRWARTETDLDLRHSRFRAAVADVAATVHGVPKDELEGEDIRQHRRARRLARGGVGVLALLVVIALVFGVVAVTERNRANDNADRAVRQAAIAQAERLSATASSKRGTESDVSLLLAAEAFERVDTPSTRAGLLGTLMSAPQLVGFVPGPHDAMSSQISPDGRLIVIGTRNGVLRFVDTASGFPTSVVALPASLHGQAVNDLRFDGRGDTLFAVTSTGEVERWDPHTRRPVGSPIRVRPNESALRSLAVSPDGTHVAVSTAFSGVTQYDLGARRTQPTETRCAIASRGAAYSDDGETLFVSGACGLEALDASSSQPQGAPFFNTDANGRMGSVAVGRTRIVVGMGQTIATDSRFVIVPAGATVLDAGTHAVVAALGEPVTVSAVAISRDGSTVVLGGADGTLAVWNTDGVELERPWQAHASSIASVSLADDGRRLVSSATDGSTALWDLSGQGAFANGPDLSAGRALHASAGQPAGGANLAISPNGGQIAIVGRATEVWGRDRRQRWVRHFEARDLEHYPQRDPSIDELDAAGSASFDPSGARVLAYGHVHDATGDRPGPAALDGKTLVVNFLTGTLHPGRYQLVFPSTFDQTPSITGSRRAPGTFNPPPRVTALDIWTGTRTGTFATAAITSTFARAYRDASPNGTPFDQTNYGMGIYDGTVDAQGRHAATISSFGVAVVDLGSGRPIGAVELRTDAHNADATTVAFSSSGDELAVGRYDGTIVRYAVPSLRRMGSVLRAQAGAVHQLAYQPNGTLLASASADRVELIDLASEAHVASISFSPLSGHGGVAQFDAAGRVLLTQGYLESRPALTWTMTPTEWVVAACRAAGRNLTRAEWTDLVGRDAPYHQTCSQWPAGT
jgi:WD40 repeat protein